MNITVYIFGKLGARYTQYPDDFTREVFSTFEKNIKSPTQLMIHRHDALIYYAYLRKLSEQNKYIGIAFVFNGVMCTDIHGLCKLCEDNLTNWIVNGEILEFADNGDIISKVDKLYKISSEFSRLSTSLSTQIESLGLTFTKLPPTNYAVSADTVKTYNIEDTITTFNETIKEYSNIYIYTDSTSNTLNSYSDKLRRLNNENTELKEINAKLNRQKKRTTIVTILSIIVAIGVIAIIVFANRSSEQQRQITQLTTDNQHLGLYIKDLQRDSSILEQNLSNTRYELNQSKGHISRLKHDSTTLTQKNKELTQNLETANKNIRVYQQTIEQKNKDIQQKDRTISDLKSQLNRNTSSSVISPITISNVSLASTKKNGHTASDFGYNIYSSNSYYIKVKMTYRSNISGYKYFTIKLYGPSTYNSSGYSFYSSEVENVYLYSSSTTNYTFTKKLGRSGNKLSAGNYYVEICYDGNILKTHYFTIK